MGQIWFRRVTLESWSKQGSRGLRATRKEAAARSRPERPSPRPPKSLFLLCPCSGVLPIPHTFLDPLFLVPLVSSVWTVPSAPSSPLAESSQPCRDQRPLGHSECGTRDGVSQTSGRSDGRGQSRDRREADTTACKCCSVNPRGTRRQSKEAREAGMKTALRVQARNPGGNPK